MDGQTDGKKGLSRILPGGGEERHEHMVDDNFF